ncbi:LGFP repeat-containing protein [Nocardia aobensis]|uniref:LGFP repeat-containing protein n=1 Tax=Nocardia aobensis TaxID=257277 RepID=A0ABW6NVX7_9NOCA|nr:esterase [Nocardia sp. MDA0666]PSR60653.1 esterase [Nocardia sp. MDA0666]
MHHIARRSAAVVMAFAGTALLFTAACSNDNNDNSSSGTTTHAGMTETTGAMATGTTATMATGTPSPGETSPGNPAASETKIATQNGQEIAVSGHILTKYTEMGAVQSPLGEPTGASVQGPNGGSCQEFTGGAICWSEQTDAHVVWGDIRTAWENNGGVNGKLGYPTSDEKDNPTGKESDFTGGTITWNSADRQTTVTTK